MEEKTVKQINSVAVSCEDLEDHELVALVLAIELEPKNIKRISGYDKISDLFTEENGTKMHQKTQEAFLSYAYRRIG